MHAEQAYLFRHALMRDVAYQLQLPGDRALLHGLAFAALEDFARESGESVLDALALEICEHLSHAKEAQGLAKILAGRDFHVVELGFLERASRVALLAFRSQDALGVLGRIADSPVASAEKRVRARIRRVELLAEAGLLPRAVEEQEQAVAMAHAANETQLLGEAWRCLAVILDRRGDFERVLDANSRAQAAFSDCGDLVRRQMARRDLGVMLAARGRNDEAEALYVESLEFFARENHLHGLGYTLINLAALHADRGEQQLALPEARRGLALLRDQGDLRAVIGALNILATLLNEMGHDGESEHAFAELLGLQRKAGIRRSEGQALGNYALLARNRGQFGRARALLHRALAINRETENLRSLGIALGNLGELELLCGRFGMAAQFLSEGIDVSRRIDDSVGEGYMVAARAAIAMEQGASDLARELFNSAHSLLSTARELAKANTVSAALLALDNPHTSTFWRGVMTEDLPLPMRAALCETLEQAPEELARLQLQRPAVLAELRRGAAAAPDWRNENISDITET